MGDELDFGLKAGIVAGNLGAAETGMAGQGAPMRNPLADAEPVGAREEEFDRSLRPRTLDDFIGQRHVRDQMRVFVDAAKARDEALDHALFAGPPGLGKCVTPDTMLTTTQGMVAIGELGDLEGDSWQPITRPLAGLYGTRTADYFYNNGPSETVRITTESGYRLEGTPNHPVLVQVVDDAGRRHLRFRRMGELASGDRVAVRIGAALFGSSTRLSVEGVTAQTLDDPATVPTELTCELARLLGLLLVGGALSPGGDGVVHLARLDERTDEVRELARDVFCLELQQFGNGATGQRWGQRSPRVARLLEGLGLTRDGFHAVPSLLLRAPKLQVAEFLRGVFFGVEEAPIVATRERGTVATLQLLLANFGIESRIERDAESSGFALRVSNQPTQYEEFSEGQARDLERQVVPDHAGSHAPNPSAALADEPLQAGFNEAAAAALLAGGHPGAIHEDAADRQRPATNGPGTMTSMSNRSFGFGMTAAGVLVALSGDSAEAGARGEGQYRRGSSRSDELSPVVVHSGPQLSVVTGGGEGGVPPGASSRGTTLSVAEVEPRERGRALTRERIVHGGAPTVLRHGHARPLSVRSVTSHIRPDDAVELVWESVESIEAGYAHTVDVSVPDGHTFIGNGIVCHNTSLASIVANELGTQMHVTSGPALEKKADVAAILTSLAPRDVLFIDEIHRLSSAIEEVLYSAMEDFQIDIVLGQGPAARTLRLDIAPFTLVGATTRAGLLTTPLRDRFGMIQRLEYYSADELQQVVLRSAGLLDLEIDIESAGEIASRSRGTPRIANRLLKRVRDVAQVRHAGMVTLEVAQEALDLVDIDAEGLDRIDRMLLETILRKFSGGPVGLNTLAVAIGEESHTLEDVYEPFLLQKGFIQRTPRGRVITPLGRAHLGDRSGAALPSHGPSLFS